MASGRASRAVRRRAPIAGAFTSSVVKSTETLLANPWLAYAIIVAVQMRVIWNVWRYKDLTYGDSSHYFLDAVTWTHGFHNNIIWSPLYTDVWGSVYALFHESAFESEMAMRIAIVLIAAILVLAVMRSLLNPALALAIAVWWALVPANFDLLYEVHLFGALPIFITALVLARAPGRQAIGVALAILIGTTLLLRNEMLITTLLFAAAIVSYEFHSRRRQRISVRVHVRAYGVPLAIVLALVGVMYARSYDQGHYAERVFSVKQKLSIDQAYAYNYQQRYPTKFTGSPFTEYQTLLRQVFGKPEPSLLQATLADPRAIGGFVRWNAHLLPSGIQVAMFGATSTGDQPDYVPVTTHKSYALILSVIAVLLVLAGAWAMRREREFWRTRWLPPRTWILVLFAAEAFTTLFVVLVEQRPRPEYMYGLTVVLLALIGTCGEAVLRRLGQVRLLSPLAVGLTLALLVALPRYYSQGPRPIYNAVNRLEVARSRLQQLGSVLISAANNYEICAYLGATHERHCTSPSWPALQAELARGAPIGKTLDRAEATVIYAESALLGDPSIRKLVAAPEAIGWRQISSGTGPEGPWHVLVRAS